MCHKNRSNVFTLYINDLPFAFERFSGKLRHGSTAIFL